MAVPRSPPVVVPKTRTIDIGGGHTVTQNILPAEVRAQGRSDIQWQMRALAQVDTTEQLRLDNPPTEIIIDGKRARNFDDAQRNIVVFFGAKFAMAAMRLVESTLRSKIEAATVTRSGRLRNVTGAWRWR